jgi:hypothetical protein
METNMKRTVKVNPMTTENSFDVYSASKENTLAFILDKMNECISALNAVEFSTADGLKFSEVMRLMRKMESARKNISDVCKTAETLSQRY